MNDDATVLAHYLGLLEAIRVGAELMAQDEEERAPMAKRLKLAQEILKAHEELQEPGSPFKDKLKSEDAATVLKAQMIVTFKPVSRSVM